MIEATEVTVQNEPVLTVAEVAERLRVHPQTVRLWLKEGKLKGRLIGGTKTGYRIPASEVDRILTGEPADVITAA
jgi:excisionase family DNA binding protein